MDDILIRNTTLLDCTGRAPIEGAAISIKDGRLSRIKREREGRPGRAASVIDGSGMTLMPGLTDAHAHLALVGSGGDHGNHDWVEHVLRVSAIIGDALDEGFTTVRDAGGLEPSYARAVASGRIRGPRILPSGSVISQTGGHGDLRRANQAEYGAHSIPGLVARPEVVDGADAVRRAAREQLRRGATQIKVFASGGVLSPVDPWDSLQLSFDEIHAAVDVARGWGTYVLAHCHTAAAIMTSIDAGVHSIEHGSYLGEAEAARMLELDRYLIPTLVVLERALATSDESISPAQKRELADLVEHMELAVRVAADAGVSVGSGSDIVGPQQTGRAREITLKAALLGNAGAIEAATRVNAELFGLAHEIGTVEAGKRADLILVQGQPLERIEVLEDAGRIPVVIKGGLVAKNQLSA
jgi:imidazolonepropionase-like amidohydrolase